MSKLYLTEAQAEALDKVLNRDELWRRVTQMVTEEFGLTVQEDIDEMVGAYCYHLEHTWRDLTKGMPLSVKDAQEILDRNPGFIRTRKEKPNE